MSEDNKYTVLNNDHLKFFKFRLGDFTGDRLKIEKKLIPKFNVIDVKGFKRYNDSQNYILYSVEKQLIRKLKMMSLCNEIKHHSHQYYLLQLMHSSTKIEENEMKYGNTTWSNYNYTSEKYSVDYNSEELLLQKQQNKYRANKHKY